ncbi:MAG: TlpA family protein disulfide reductase [Dokdonella sp.]|uniref:TlpA family protein disulfide reductase n=1 Tax=Dokdonella sp. TaxID=2291710 RepID=UPI003F7F1334
MIGVDALAGLCAALAVGLALNLLLTLKVLSAARAMVVNATAEPRPHVGERVAVVEGRSLEGARITLPEDGRANALVFLSSRCPKCRAKVPEIARMVPSAETAGLRITLVTMESRRRLRGFLGDALIAACVRVRGRQYRALNRVLSTPHYLFIDAEGTLVARGDIGDEGWHGLRDQLGPDEGTSPAVPGGSAS